MSTLNVANIQSLSTSTLPLVKNSAGTELGQFVKIWVSFNGSGTVGIHDSFNVSSITDNGAGRYTLNFLITMANTNYAPVTQQILQVLSGNPIRTGIIKSDMTTTTCKVVCGTGNQHNASPTVGGFSDINFIAVAIFGD